MLGKSRERLERGVSADLGRSNPTLTFWHHVKHAANIARDSSGSTVNKCLFKTIIQALAFEFLPIYVDVLCFLAA
jgi:hypothetical protein